MQFSRGAPVWSRWTAIQFSPSGSIVMNPNAESVSASVTAGSPSSPAVGLAVGTSSSAVPALPEINWGVDQTTRRRRLIPRRECARRG